MNALRQVFVRFKTVFDDSALKKGAMASTNLEHSLGRLAKRFTALYVARRAVGALSDFAQYTEDLSKSAQIMGVNVAQLQRWRHAAQVAGVSNQTLQTSFLRLQRSMLRASQGIKGPRTAFKRLGIDLKDAEGNLRPVEQVLLDMAGPMTDLASKTERTALLQVLFGKAGASMAPLLNKGADGVRQLLGEIDRLGGGISGEAIEKVEEFKDQTFRMELAAKSLAGALGVTLFPILTRVLKIFTRMTTRTGLQTAKVLLLIGVTHRLAAAFYAAGVAGTVSMLKTAGLVGLVMVGIAALVLAFEDVVVAIEGGDSILGQLADSIEDFADMHKTGFMADVVGVWRNLVGLAEKFWGFLDRIIKFTGNESVEDAFDLSDLPGEGSGRPMSALDQRLQANGARLQESLRTSRLEFLGLPTRDPQEILRPTARDRQRRILGGGQPSRNFQQTNQNEFHITEAQDPAATRRTIMEVLERQNQEVLDAVQGED